MDEFKVRNMTPHPIVCAGVTYQPDPEGPARVESTSEEIDTGYTGDLPVVFTYYQNPIGLPERVQGVVLIVSRLVRDALGDVAPVDAAAYIRPDVVCPDTGPDSVIRDNNGRIVGVRRFTY